MKLLRTKFFSRTYLHLVFIFITVFFIMYSVYQDFALIKNFDNEMKKSVKSLSRSLKERIETVDKLYYLLESETETYLRPILQSLYDDYEKNQNVEIKLDSYTDDQYLNIYIINSDFKIINSTLESDIGMDFKLQKNFFKSLEEILENGVYHSPRFSLSFKDNKINKYAYLPSKDKKYIFEVSYAMEKYSGFLNEDSFENLYNIKKLKYRYVDEINIFSSKGISYHGNIKLKDEEEKKRYEYFEKARIQNKEQSFLYKNKMNKTTYLYIPYKFLYGESYNNGLTLEIIYSNSIFLKEIRDRMIKQALIILGFLILMFFINDYFNEQFIKPLDKFISVIKHIKNRNFNFKVEIKKDNEIKTLAQHFNKMVDEINSLVKEKEVANSLLQKYLKESEKGYLKTVRALSNAIDAKDKYTGGHCERVMNLSLIFANYIGLDEEDKKNLIFGSLLHDIGKIGIKDSILNKPGAFTDEEFDIMKEHPEIGYDIIKNIEFLEKAKPSVLHHHERFDGRGYPAKLEGENIPYLARILSITDAFEAMTSNRIYRKNTFSVEEAFFEMKDCKSKHFDPNLVDKFIEAYMHRFGTQNLNREAELVEL